MGYTMICQKKATNLGDISNLTSWDPFLLPTWPSHHPIPPSQLPAANIWPSPENARHVTAAAAFLGVVASRRIRVGSAEAKSQKMKPAAARLGLMEA